MNTDGLSEGQTVIKSPVGPGTITGFTMRGYPQVNGIAVAWLQTNNLLWNPHNKTEEERSRMVA